MSRMRGREWVGLAVLTWLALALRVQASRQSLWLDELHTGWVVADGWQAVAARASQGNSDPLYFGCVWLVTQLCGSTEFTLRGVSIFCGVLLVPGAYAFVRRWTNSRVAAGLTAACVMTDRDFLFFASEARPYAMVQLLSLAQVAAFWRTLESTLSNNAVRCEVPKAAPGRVFWGVTWAGLSVLLLWTHLTTAWLMLSQLIFLLAIPAGRTMLGQRWVWSVVLLGGITIAPLVPAWTEVAARRSNWQLFVPQLSWQTAITLFPVVPYVLVPGVLAVIAHGYLAWRPPRRRDDLLPSKPHRNVWRAAGWTCCWFLVPMIGAALCSHWDGARLFFRRYLMVASLAPPVLGGILVSTVPSRIGRSALLLVVLGFCLFHPVRHWVDTGGWPLPDRHQDWESATKQILLQRNDPWPVLLDAGLIETPWVRRKPADQRAAWREYLLYPLASIYPCAVPRSLQIPIASDSLDPILDADDQRRITERSSVWLLTVRHDTWQEVAKRTIQQLQSLGSSWQTGEVHVHGSLRLVELHVTSSSNR